MSAPARYRVRMVLGLEVYGDAGDRRALAGFIRRGLEGAVVDAEVTHRVDQGIVIVAHYAAPSRGALAAAAGIAELVDRALERALEGVGNGHGARALREHFAREPRVVDVKVRPAR